MNQLDISYWKNKKKKRIKIFVSSFINYNFYNSIKDKNIDIFRIDIEEIAINHNINSVNKVSLNDLIINFKNNYINNAFLAVDIPVIDLYNEGKDVSNVVDIYKKSDVDFIILNIEHNVTNIAKKLTNFGIPYIISFKNGYEDGDLRISVCIEELIHLGNTGAYLIITENLNEPLYNKIRNSCPIPVISDSLNKDNDGHYLLLSKIIGLIENKNSFLNIKDLVSQSYDIYLNKINEK
ncbi:MAG TPA: hypothetical protein PLG34_13240 [Spirochaetota bacterium]|jgi:ketopantoate hydroxymethyltransferase|nr:MAG: 3-methyl-2-oxobutanoate hydroxymethyltransferase [Spirochaetes bacterium ADurb.Bin133]HNZ25601.1 hypothetical protein [Spirochaetota bacterium]HPY88933.1 hypothetical protein [Spirochaetota bacterium]